MSDTDEVLYDSPMVPNGKLISGHTKEFQKDVLGFLTRLSKEYGDVAKFRFGPFQNVYLISNPDLIKQILVTKQKSFVKSKDSNAIKPLVGDEGLLTSEKTFTGAREGLFNPPSKGPILAIMPRI